MLAALGWGVLASSPLVLGAVIGLVRPWPARLVGLVMAFGAGAVISAVSFDLALEGVKAAGFGLLAAGLGAGSVGFYLLDTWVDRRADAPGGAGASLVIGSSLDSIPENLVLGLGLARGEGISVALLVAVIVENLPEGMGSAVSLEEQGMSRRAIVRLWLTVTVVVALMVPIGRALGEAAGDEVKAVANGVAAGALLAMLVVSMAPEAREKAGSVAGLATALGFAVGVALSGV